ncbi:hypothetical protein EVAR_27103_1 [Eumeta japonica]|uniref:Uncharacterized protein n=1 Tax=Eumeta variegata TaxID=151549 RepID=A0A4C1VKL8_EUMVA|nr:hypothetical protein EVAR_27103_1 [Eumeta japonica]
MRYGGEIKEFSVTRASRKKRQKEHQIASLEADCPQNTVIADIHCRPSCGGATSREVTRSPRSMFSLYQLAELAENPLAVCARAAGVGACIFICPETGHRPL